MTEFETASVVGAGVAGLSCARELAAAGVDVTVYDKARGPGGRTATRRQGTMRFDHGAQVLAPGVLVGTAAEHVVRPWVPRVGGVRRTAGELPAPTMSAAARALAEGLHVVPRTLVAPLTANGLRTLEGPLPAADRIVLAVPAPQAAVLLADLSPDAARTAASVAYDPCWTAMVAWDQPLGLVDDVRDAPGEDLAWAAAQASRPGRDPGERWVLQASAEWSLAHLEDDADRVAHHLLDAFAATLALSVDLPQPTLLTAHRWRYSRPRTTLRIPFLECADGVLAAGDWCGERDLTPIARSVASGRAAAGALLHAPAGAGARR